MIKATAQALYSSMERTVKTGRSSDLTNLQSGLFRFALFQDLPLPLCRIHVSTW